jgi:hypothetical protein
MATTGKLDLTIKINELPQAKGIENGWKHFELDCDGRIVSVSVKPKIWKKLTEAQANFPMWVAAVSYPISRNQTVGKLPKRHCLTCRTLRRSAPGRTGRSIPRRFRDCGKTEDDRPYSERD